MMIEKSGSIRLKDIPIPSGATPEQRELAQGMVRDHCSIPDKTHTTLPPRETFYGDVPLTAEEMYRHTKNVNAYYFGEIGVEVGNEPDILICRRAGFAALERQPRYLHNAVFHGSYDEDWTLRKVLRRFVWHDRIHGRAMWRMACALCGSRRVADPYRFA